MIIRYSEILKSAITGADNTGGQIGQFKTVPKTIKQVADILLGGGVALLPTSTIYGLSCVYNNRTALNKVYRIKNRPAGLPFIILIPKIEDLNFLIDNKTNLADKLIKKYWLSDNPQPLTLVFNKNRNLDLLDFSDINSGNENNYKNSCVGKILNNVKTGDKPGSIYSNGRLKNTIAIRLDPLQAINKIMDLTGPLISTSATISGTDISPKKIEEVPPQVLKQADIVLDFENELEGQASAIIDVTAEYPVVLRQGRISDTF